MHAYTRRWQVLRQLTTYYGNKIGTTCNLKITKNINLCFYKKKKITREQQISQFCVTEM